MADVVEVEHRIGAELRPRDGVVAELAARQHGVVARAQLTEIGLGRGAIRRRLEAGRLLPVHRGVYAVGHRRISPRGRLMAAVLAAGPGALASHRSAAWMLELRRGGPTPEVTVPTRTRGPRRNLLVHLARDLRTADRTERDGIPTTTVARTLLDLADVLRPRELERAFEDAERLRILDLGEVRALIARSPGRHGLARINALLSEHAEASFDTSSELERRFLDLCRCGGLPAPATNVLVAGYVVDVLWPESRLVVELDGHAYHRTRAAFERDRVRDAALQLAGYRVLRITYRRLELEPEAILAEVLKLLAMPPPPS